MGRGKGKWERGKGKGGFRGWDKKPEKIEFLES